ncbi:unnamed protein product [Gordionus sp. m RMFG-2023]
MIVKCIAFILPLTILGISSTILACWYKYRLEQEQKDENKAKSIHDEHAKPISVCIKLPNIYAPKYQKDRFTPIEESQTPESSSHLTNRKYIRKDWPSLHSDEHFPNFKIDSDIEMENKGI